MEVALRPRHEYVEDIGNSSLVASALNVESKVSASSAIVFFGEQKRLIPMNLVHTAQLVSKW